MGRYVERVWSGNPSGATRAERAPCWFRAYVPDPLVGAEVDEWPARADATRADMAAVVSSAVAAIGGAGASTIEGPHDGDDPPGPAAAASADAAGDQRYPRGSGATPPPRLAGSRSTSAPSACGCSPR